jgi:RNA polymerase-binding transcription factor DksA
MAQKTKKPAKAKPVAKKLAPAKKPAAKAKPAPLQKPLPPAKKQQKPVTKPVPPAPVAKAAKKLPPKKTTSPIAAKAAPLKKPTPAKKLSPVSKKPAPAKAPATKAAPAKKGGTVKKPVVLNAWLIKQRERLLQLKDTLLDSMNGVGRDTLRSRAEGGEASAFGMHTADAGSDAYDRDFALSLLSQERDSLFEIDASLKKIEDGNYGLCEISGKPIPHNRLEALPFARYTVECQSELEKSNRLTRVRQPVTSLFGLNEDEGEAEEEETHTEAKD